MSVWKTLLNLFAFYALCYFYGFLMLLKLLWDMVFRGPSTVFNVKQRPHPPNCLTDPSIGRHNYVKLKNVKLHYVEAGDHSKPLLLCLHGFPEFWYSWRHQLREFSNEFWVVAVDLRGYGDSDKPLSTGAYTMDKIVGDIEELIPTLGRRSCIVMGHDWGGVIAWLLATRFPNVVDRLIVLNAPHPAVWQKHVRSCLWQFLKSWYMFFVQIPYFPEFCFRLNDIGLFKAAFLRHPRGKETFCEHDIEAYKYTFESPGAFTGPLNYYRNLPRALWNDKQKATVEKVTVPVLIVWGTDDTALCKELAQLSSDVCEQATVRLVKGASHWVQQDSPQVVNRHVHEFLHALKKPGKEQCHSQSLVGRVRSQLVSSVFSSAIKLSKMPVVVYPIIGIYQANNWVAGLNRKLL